MFFSTILHSGVMCLMLLSNGAPALDSLEQEVAAHPDNLKLGSNYRQAAIKARQFDRSIRFFEKLVDAHPRSANAYINLGSLTSTKYRQLESFRSSASGKMPLRQCRNRWS